MFTSAPSECSIFISNFVPSVPTWLRVSPIQHVPESGYGLISFRSSLKFAYIARKGTEFKVLYSNQEK